MVSPQREANRKVIDSTVKQFKQSANIVFQKGMEDMLNYAVEFALHSHDEGHQQHLIQGDSYGWGLFHNSRLVSYKIVSQVSKKKNQLLSAIRSVNVPNTKSWCGVIMAGMSPMGYFSTDYEIEILELTKDEIRANFSRYFKPFMQ